MIKTQAFYVNTVGRTLPQIQQESLLQSEIELHDMVETERPTVSPSSASGDPAGASRSREPWVLVWVGPP